MLLTDGMMRTGVAWRLVGLRRSPQGTPSSELQAAILGRMGLAGVGPVLICTAAPTGRPHGVGHCGPETSAEPPPNPRGPQEQVQKREAGQAVVRLPARLHTLLCAHCFLQCPPGPGSVRIVPHTPSSKTRPGVLQGWLRMGGGGSGAALSEL